MLKNDLLFNHFIHTTDSGISFTEIWNLSNVDFVFWWNFFMVLWDYFLKLLDDRTDHTNNKFLHELTYVLVDIIFLMSYNHKDHMHSVYLHEHALYVVLDYHLALLHNHTDYMDNSLLDMIWYSRGPCRISFLFAL